jgi:hypothetical protein
MSTVRLNMTKLYRWGLCLSLVLFGYLIPHPRVQAQTSAVPWDSGQSAVASTATLIVGANGNRTGLLISNPGSVAIYFGNSLSVTTANGAYLPGGGSVSLPTRAPVFGISSGATQTVTFAETFEKLP